MAPVGRLNLGRCLIQLGRVSLNSFNLLCALLAGLGFEVLAGHVAPVGRLHLGRCLIQLGRVSLQRSGDKALSPMTDLVKAYN